MSKIKVMVVENDIAVMHMVTTKLISFGFEVISQANGTSAYETAQYELPEIVIASTQLPGFSGVELAQRLSYLPSMSNAKVLLLTQRGLETDVKVQENVNIVGCISKPFTHTQLKASIAGILKTMQV